MGYYTSYSIEVYDKKTDKEMRRDLLADREIDKELGEALINVKNSYFEDYKKHGGPDTLSDIITCETLKWYEHDSDMLELSMQYPDYIFVLNGIGEDNFMDDPDMWKSYYVNGKMQTTYAQIYYEPIDERIFENE